MSQQFTRCKTCGKIFPAAEPDDEICPKCLEEQASDEIGDDNDEQANRDRLRLLKNALRDAQAKGVMLNTHELSEQTGVREPTIWHFINNGELDTAGFDDPKVRDFMKRKRIERAREAAKAMRGDSKPAAGEAKAKPSGFHTRNDEKKR